ncbi:MAG: hypothetical protein ACREP7_01495, partial [Lysobacter sp.]
IKDVATLELAYDDPAGVTAIIAMTKKRPRCEASVSSCGRGLIGTNDPDAAIRCCVYAACRAATAGIYVQAAFSRVSPS